MKGALQEIGDGAHALLATFMLLAITVFVVLGRMTIDQWCDMAWKILALFGGTHVGLQFIAQRAGLPAAQVVPPSQPPSQSPSST